MNDIDKLENFVKGGKIWQEELLFLVQQVFQALINNFG